MSLQTPLGRALGLGSAKSGFSHWWGQRLSAAALVILGLWFAASLVGIGGADHATVAAWIAATPHAVLLILLAATPPCAATVCERVGKTLVSTAVLKPASDN